MNRFARKKITWIPILTQTVDVQFDVLLETWSLGSSIQIRCGLGLFQSFAGNVSLSHRECGCLAGF